MPDLVPHRRRTSGQTIRAASRARWGRAGETHMNTCADLVHPCQSHSVIAALGHDCVCRDPAARGRTTLVFKVLEFFDAEPELMFCHDSIDG